MAKWEYCRVDYSVVRDGNGEIDETIEIHLPDGTITSEKGTGNGMVTVLNDLGAKEWEVFNLGERSTWLKREKPPVPGTVRTRRLSGV